MKKIYQTIVDKENGNCMQAAIASLLDKELDEVPHFLENLKKRDKGEDVKDHESHTILYLYKEGYDCNVASGYTGRDRNNKEYTLAELAKIDGGLNGYFYASVPSQTFKEGTHAVIVDHNLKVIHDPNPNQLSLN